MHFLLDVRLIYEESRKLFLLYKHEEENSLKHEDDEDSYVEEVDCVVAHVILKVHVSNMNQQVDRSIYEKHEKEGWAEDGRVAQKPD